MLKERKQEKFMRFELMLDSQSTKYRLTH